MDFIVFNRTSHASYRYLSFILLPQMSIAIFHGGLLWVSTFCISYIPVQKDGAKCHSLVSNGFIAQYTEKIAP